MKITFKINEDTFSVEGKGTYDLAENQYKALLKEVINNFPIDYLYPEGNKIIRRYTDLYGSPLPCLDPWNRCESSFILGDFELPYPEDSPEIKAFKNSCFWNKKGICEWENSKCIGKKCSIEKCELLKKFINELKK